MNAMIEAIVLRVNVIVLKGTVVKIANLIVSFKFDMSRFHILYFIIFLAPITSIMVMDESGAALANATIEFRKDSVQTGCVTTV